MMGVQKQELICAKCGAPFFGDKRHKYCSEECYTEAHREQARANFKRRYETMYEQERERQRKRYWSNPEREKARSTAWFKQHPEARHRYYMKHKEASKQ